MGVIGGGGGDVSMLQYSVERDDWPGAVVQPGSHVHVQLDTVPRSPQFGVPRRPQSWGWENRLGSLARFIF